MELNHTNNGSRKQRTVEDIMQLLEEYQKSDSISVREYCEMIDISEATFYNWQKKYGSSRVMESPEAGFIPIQIAQETPPEQPLQAEVRVIKLYGTLSVEQFKTLLS